MRGPRARHVAQCWRFAQQGPPQAARWGRRLPARGAGAAAGRWLGGVRVGRWLRRPQAARGGRRPLACGAGAAAGSGGVSVGRWRRVADGACMPVGPAWTLAWWGVSRALATAAAAGAQWTAGALGGGGGGGFWVPVVERGEAGEWPVALEGSSIMFWGAYALVCAPASRVLCARSTLRGRGVECVELAGGVSRVCARGTQRALMLEGAVRHMGQSKNDLATRSATSTAVRATRGCSCHLGVPMLGRGTPPCRPQEPLIRALVTAYPLAPARQLTGGWFLLCAPTPRVTDGCLVGIGRSAT